MWMNTQLVQKLLWLCILITILNRNIVLKPNNKTEKLVWMHVKYIFKHTHTQNVGFFHSKIKTGTDDNKMCNMHNPSFLPLSLLFLCCFQCNLSNVWVLSISQADNSSLPLVRWTVSQCFTFFCPSFWHCLKFCNIPCRLITKSRHLFSQFKNLNL